MPCTFVPDSEAAIWRKSWSDSRRQYATRTADPIVRRRVARLALTVCGKGGSSLNGLTDLPCARLVRRNSQTESRLSTGRRDSPSHIWKGPFIAHSTRTPSERAARLPTPRACLMTHHRRNAVVRIPCSTLSRVTRKAKAYFADNSPRCHAIICERSSKPTNYR